MAYARRPLPPPPGRPMGSRPNPTPPTDLYSVTDPYFMSYAYPAHNVQPAEISSEPPSSIPVGTLLHKGFYDLLSMIPTPSPSRFLGWGGTNSPSPLVSPSSQNDYDATIAGPPYEALKPSPTKAAPPVQHAKKGRRISKDMVSKPTGFVHLVHASDADQLEALLTRWGPDGLGKLGDPRWANPIKNFVRQKVQANAVNQVVNAFRTDKSDLDGERVYGQLHVVNGISAPNSSILTTAAQENVSLSNSIPEGLPGRPGNSTIRWGGGLQTHVEEAVDLEGTVTPPAPPEPPKRVIVPSLATLDKAVSARIFFENLYFPLLRHPPSREQRRLAMERDMQNMHLSEEQKDALRSRWRQNESDYLRDRRRKVDASAFIKLKTIGHGAFGVVSLVKERSTGCVFAMKQLRKVDMLRKGQEGHVRAERDVLKSASMIASPTGAEWIVRLHYSFQDRDHLYLVLEYMGGGDLLNLLIERDVFEEDFTRFYIAEMILAIESCHKLGFIHRDIKPDNFLFDPQGHIRLSDFGLATDLHWAHDTSYYEQQRLHLLRRHGIDLEDTNGIADGRKTKRMSRKEIEALMGGGDGQEGIFTWREKNRRKLAYSVCGTNSYMSPEVIRGQGYTFSCDWWSLGVIMYECLYGFPPFVSNSRHVTRQKILNWRNSLKFPSRPHVSSEGIELIQRLLCEPEDRLGSQAISTFSRRNSIVGHARRASFFPVQGNNTSDGADLIKSHPWFKGIDWQNIHRYPAPFKPELRNPEDTRHFDDDIPPEPLAPANGAPADATKDPMLLDKAHGAEILVSRKALAFAGFTHKSPRAIGYLRADKAFDLSPNTYGQEVDRGRTLTREAREVGKGRAMSM